MFAQLPFGLVVLSRGGDVVAVNDAARALLRPPSGASAESNLRCCDLLGCGRPGGPLHSTCFSDLVAAGEGAADVRVPIEGAAAPLTATSLGVDDGQIVVQITPRDPVRSARRLRPSAGSTLRVVTLGRTRLGSADAMEDDAWLQQRPGEVFQYLICERHRAVPSDEIAEALWPNAGPSSINNVRFAIFDLRRRLEPQRASRSRSAFITSGKGCYRLNTASVVVDADEFHDAVERGVADFIAGRAADSAATLDHAISLYGGDFLSDLPYATWAMLERARLHGVMIKALRLRAELARDAEDFEGLLQYVTRLGQMEPLDLEIQRHRIETCLSLGRYGEASRCYAELRQRMATEFGQRPPFELSELARSPRAGTPRGRFSQRRD